jgi:undecaprenyl diphosphate synthase
MQASITCSHPLITRAWSNDAPLFSPEQLAEIDRQRIPRHVAIIPDGNRRWAKKQQFSTEIGHHEGADILMEIVKAAKELGVKAISFYLFSTENWSRPQEEIDALLLLLESYLIDQRESLRLNGIRLHTIGDPSRFPPSVLKELEETQQATAACSAVDLIFALNYGSRDEMRRACQKMIKECSCGTLDPDAITERTIAQFLDTARWPDPDLLIRTSGEMRLSNFLLWQMSYAEVYVTEILWPDFRPVHFLEALSNFQKRERRLGGA